MPQYQSNRRRPRAARVPRRAFLVFFLTTALLGMALLAAAIQPKTKTTPPTPSRFLFERRILPIFRAKDPSMCSECHLSGVDLKDYIRPSEAQTFASLRDAGLIDMKSPADSHILRFIRMSRPDSPLVNQKVRAAEYEAFRDWIVAAVRDPKLAALSALSPSERSGPTVPDPVIRHTRLDAVVASFERNIWSQQGRCINCHQAGTPENDKNVQKFGPRVAWFKPDSAERTMRTLIAQGDVDVEHPDRSLLLLKPLGRVSHGGGVKMLYGDAGYKMFRAWLEDYAKSVKGGYRTARDLPPPPSDSLVDMNCVLAVSGGPAGWKDRSLRVDVYPWDGAGGGWSKRPLATGERIVSLSQDGTTTATNLIMYLIAPPGASTAQSDRLLRTLGDGRYLLRYYCDTTGELDRDYTIATNDPRFFQGEQEVSARWNARAGWGGLVNVPIETKSPVVK